MKEYVFKHDSPARLFAVVLALYSDNVSVYCNRSNVVTCRETNFAERAFRFVTNLEMSEVHSALDRYGSVIDPSTF